MQTATRWLAADRYEVGEVVGRGGYGMVCRGFDRKTGRDVALKMLAPEAGRNADAVERMLREQQAMLALSGTCAVTAIDLFRLESGAPCLVMEWLEGLDLEQQLSIWEDAKQRGSFEQLLLVIEPIALTLERAHEIGILHRDIKPANIFLTAGPTPSVRLLDFGLSRMRSAAPLTALGMVMGSPSYIAPETWRGNSALLDGRADLYALAVIVFRFLTGQVPFDVPDLIGKMTAVTSAPRPSVVAIRPELPPALDAWMSRALAVEPADRFQTGGDFSRSLAAAVRGEVWPAADAPAPAPVSSDESAPERKSALASAWQAASSLLKRFTGPRDVPTTPPRAPVTHPPTAAATNAPAATPAIVAPPAPSTPPAATPSNPPPTAPSKPPPPKKPTLPPKAAESALASAEPAADDRATIWLDGADIQEEVAASPEAKLAGGKARKKKKRGSRKKRKSR